MAMLPLDVARCRGVADLDSSAPVPMCRDCERYRWQNALGARTPMFDGAPAVLERYGERTRLECVQRIKPDTSDT